MEDIDKFIAYVVQCLPYRSSRSYKGDGALIWVEENIEQDRFALAFGHYEKHLHVTSFIDPAVSITRDGAATGDARIFNSPVRRGER